MRTIDWIWPLQSEKYIHFYVEPKLNGVQETNIVMEIAHSEEM